MQRILVVGAGAMGSQIAMVCALAGYDTTVTDVADEALDRATSQLHARLDRDVAKGRRTREDVDAAEAHAIGLVTAVVPPDDLRAELRRLADRILAKGPLAVRLAKLVVRAGMDADQRTGQVVERLAQALLYTTADKTEGASAFLEKRSPTFKGV